MVMSLITNSNGLCFSWANAASAEFAEQQS
jgi:hypothetical protein